LTAGRLIVRGATAAAGGLVVRLGARLIFLVVAAQLYGAALFGAYSLAVAAVELAVAVGGLGMKRLLFQHLDERGSRAEAHVVADSALLVTLASLLLGGAIMLAVTIVPATLISANTAGALFILAPAIAGQALIDLLLAATRWKHLIRYEVAARSLVEPYAALAAAAAAWYAGFGEIGLLIGYWFGTLAALLYAASGAARSFALADLRRYRPRRRRSLAILRSAAANTAADALSGLFVRLDLYLVGILLGERSAGIYGMARQLAVPIRQVRQSFDGLLAPMVARTLQSGGAGTAALALASAARLILALQLPLLIALVAAGRPLLHWLGPEFAAGWIAAILIAAAEAVQGAYGVGELLFVYRLPRLGLGIMASSIVLGLAAGFVLTSIWGLNGAALAVLVTYGVRAWSRRSALKASLGVAVPLQHSLGPVVAGAAGGALAALIAQAGPGPDSWAVALAAGLLVYAAILIGWLRIRGETLALRHFTA